MPEKNIQQPNIADNVLDAFNNILENKKEVSEKNKKQLEEIKQKTNISPIISQPRTIETKEMTQEKIKEFWSLIDSNLRDIFAYSLDKEELKLSDLPEILNIKEIMNAEFKDLKIIPYFVQLEKLSFEMVAHDKFDFTPLQNNYNLKELGISGDSYFTPMNVNLNSLKNLINLKYINFAYLRINSFTFLKNMVKLEIIRLYDVEIYSLEGLEYCTNLKELELDHVNITDLNPIMNLHNLEQITIPEGIDTFDFELSHPNCIINVK